MLSCLIYSPFPTIALSFSCFERFYIFTLKPSYVSRMKIFEALWIKVDSKRGPQTPNIGIPWPPQSREIQVKHLNKWGEPTWLVPPRFMVASSSLGSSCFLVAVRLPCGFMFSCRMFAMNGCFQPHFIPNHPIPFRPCPSHYLLRI